MRLLLDTHVWVWQLLDEERLSRRAASALGARGHEIFLSPITIWETLVMARKGRLELAPSATEWVRAALRRSPVAMVPLTHEVAIRSESLDGFASQDPADRFLVATAMEHGLTLVTADGAMRDFDRIQTLW